MKKKPLFLGVTALAVAFPVLAIASPVEIPNAFTDGDIISADAFNENFDAIADAVNDNDARITALEGAIESAGVPTGTIAFFPVLDAGTVDGCPLGWAEYADLRGRVPVGLAQGGTLEATMGSALADEGQRTINQVVSHTHPDTFSIANGGGSHTHTTEPDGGHDHSINLEVSGGYGTFAAMGTTNNNGGDVSSTPIDNEPDHTHTIASSGSHGHTIDGSVQSTGSTTVDVTMPYIQLLACVKQ